MDDSPPRSAVSFELHFERLRSDGGACVFPCDANGRVDLDALSDRARAAYLVARVLAGGGAAIPVVRAAVASG